MSGENFFRKKFTPQKIPPPRFFSFFNHFLLLFFDFCCQKKKWKKKKKTKNEKKMGKKNFFGVNCLRNIFPHPVKLHVFLVNHNNLNPKESRAHYLMERIFSPLIPIKRVSFASNFPPPTHTYIQIMHPSTPPHLHTQKGKSYFSKKK